MPSIVTPIDLCRRPRSILTRLHYLATATQNTEFQLCIGHAERGLTYDNKLRRLAAQFDHIALASTTPKSSLPCTSVLRNAAARMSTHDTMLLLDADIFPDISLLRSLTSNLSETFPIQMAPCLYLTDSSTKRILKGGDVASEIDRALAFLDSGVMHWAMPSSVIALRTDDYNRVGGFYELYEGHGYEDFDFMVRIALANNLLAPTSDLVIDRVSRAPLLNVGFRAQLGCLCIENLLRRNIALHLYHDNDAASDYRQSRAKNAALYRDRMMSLVNASEVNSVVPHMINAFYNACLKVGSAPSSYYALFDNRPRHLLSHALWPKAKRCITLILRRLKRHLARLWIY